MSYFKDKEVLNINSSKLIHFSTMIVLKNENCLGTWWAITRFQANMDMGRKWKNAYNSATTSYNVTNLVSNERD